MYKRNCVRLKKADESPTLTFFFFFFSVSLHAFVREKLLGDETRSSIQYSIFSKMRFCRRKLLDTSHHVAIVHVPVAHSERPLSQNALPVLPGASWRDVHHVRDHAARGDRAGVFQNPSLPLIGKVSPSMVVEFLSNPT